MTTTIIASKIFDVMVYERLEAAAGLTENQTPTKQFAIDQAKRILRDAKVQDPGVKPESEKIIYTQDTLLGRLASRARNIILSVDPNVVLKDLEQTDKWRSFTHSLTKTEKGVMNKALRPILHGRFNSIILSEAFNTNWPEDLLHEVAFGEKSLKFVRVIFAPELPSNQ